MGEAFDDDDLDDRIQAELVDAIGPGYVAVIDGPLVDPTVVEKRRLLEDTSLEWALERYVAHARELSTREPDGEQARRPVAIVYVAPDDQVHLIVEPTPALENKGLDYTRMRVPLLQPHHVAGRNQRLGRLAISDFPASRKSVTVYLPGSHRLGAKFANKSFRYTHDGVGYGRGGRYLLVDGNTASKSDYVDERAKAYGAQLAAPVIVRYSFDDGVTVTGNTRLYSERIAESKGTAAVIGWDGRSSEMQWRLEWARRNKYWYVPGSRRTAWARSSVERVADALRERGIPNVEVNYAPPPAGVSTPPELEKPAEPATPHGWPPVPLDRAKASLNEEGQLRAVPRYSADNYRWHAVRLGPRWEPRPAVATNIEGHLVVAHSPTFMVPFWVLVIDGERRGRGEEEFAVLANHFHDQILPQLEPLPEPRPPVTEEEIAASRVDVAQRKARSRALDDVARAAGIEVCPKAIFEIEPVPREHSQIKTRAEAFAELVKHYRNLHQLELWAAGKLDAFPWKAAYDLNNQQTVPSHLDEKATAYLAGRWARERFDLWLETVLDGMQPRDRDEAERVLEFCVRDIASGRRRAREGVAHSPPAEPISLLDYRAPEPAPEPRPAVIPPAPASKPRARKASAPIDLDRVAQAWTKHVESRPERPWTNVPTTSCFVRNEDGVEVTMCPTPQKRPVKNCPPLEPSLQDKARRVMVCGDGKVLLFGNLADAQREGENMALRQRVQRAAKPDDEWPAADDFAAQERFLDALVPTRFVFERERPFLLVPVEVGPPRLSSGVESAELGKWGDKPIPADAQLEPQVLVGKTRATGLREFVDALGDELFVYRGKASPETLRGLLERLSGPERLALNRKQTANDIGHGIFRGRSLYWLGDGEAEFVGPVTANGKLATGRAKQDVLDRLSNPMALPESLPHGWTLDDSIVLAVQHAGELAWSVWNAPSERFSSKRESDDAWSEPEPLSNAPDPNSGWPGYAKAVLATLDPLLDDSPATVRFRVAGPWLGLVFPSDYGSRVMFEEPTGGELDLELLERVRDVHLQRSIDFPHEEDHADEHRRAKRRLEWAREWLRKRAREAKRELAAAEHGPPAVASPKPRKPVQAAPAPALPAAPAEPERKPKPAKSKPKKPTDAELVALAREHGVAPSQGRTQGNRIALLYEAEKRGWGPKMRTWLVKQRLIKPEWATEYGARARGRLAFERGEAWPPPPARGEVYSSPEYEGLLASLADSPKAVAALELAEQWSAAIEGTQGSKWLLRHRDLAAETRDAVRMSRDRVFDTETTAEAARARRTQMDKRLDGLTHDMRLSLDTTLFDKSRPAEDVYRTLCEISNDLAKDVLEDLYGIEFPDKRDHYALCDDQTTFGELDRKAKAHAEQKATDEREHNRRRLADARALLAVADEARSKGELTERRFNAAYWRLHPDLGQYDREERRLKLTWFPSFRQARGIAPVGSGKATDAWVRGPENHGFHVTVRDTDDETTIVERLIAAIRKEAETIERELGGAATSGASSREPSMSVGDRGRLALERGEWPPAPVRGKTYTKSEYLDLIRSLEHAPEVAAAREFAKQWTETIRGIESGTWYFHGHNLAIQVRDKTDLRSSKESEGVPRTPESALARYAKLREDLADLVRQMQRSMDPSLYDGTRSAQDVFSALCEVDPAVAKNVTSKLYGLHFGGPSDEFQLCDGRLAWDEFERRSNAHHYEVATRELRDVRQQIDDARALLAVGEHARGRGKLTEAGFNESYWIRHPLIVPRDRERLRLRLVWTPGLRPTRPGVAPPQTQKSTEAKVFGPKGRGFVVRVRGKSQTEVVEALLAQIRSELAELEREAAALEADAPLPDPRPSRPEPTMTRTQQHEAEADDDFIDDDYARELETVEAAQEQRRFEDARALLAVSAEAKARGELTVAAFNRNYWRTQKIPKYRRADLQMRVSPPNKNAGPPESWKTLAMVVGPHNQGFFVELPGEASEAVAASALVDQIRREFVALERELAPAPAPAPARGRRSKAAAHTPARAAPRSKPPAKVDAAKLRKLADSMEAKATQEIEADRLENTPRRAEQAAQIRKRARRELALAQTLRRIADAGEAGGYSYVARIANKADLELLERPLMLAGSARRKAEGVYQWWEPAEPEPADIDYAELRPVKSDRANLNKIVEWARKHALPGVAEALAQLEQAAPRYPDFGPLAPAEVDAVEAVVAAVRKAKISNNDTPTELDNLADDLRERDRFAKLGIVDTATLKDALREYLTCCRGHVRRQTEDPIAVKKRELAFAKIPGFFPTPRQLVERMVEEAELEPGMRVLEPSAGDGAIALVIRERHPDVELDLIERQYSLRELLQAQGFAVIADDFCAYHPPVPYDRILMNPPFEKGQDVQHIGHALDLLAPGGRLVAIASTGLQFRNDPKTTALRERIAALGGSIEALPPGSFQASGTNVSTVLVVADNPGAVARHTPPRVAAPRPQPRSEAQAMSECSADSPSSCQPKPKRRGRPKKTDVQAQFDAALAKQQAQAAADEPKPSKSKKAGAKKAAATSKAKKASKEPATETVAAKPSKAGKKKAAKKKKGPKLPSWHYTDYRGDRYRYREVADEFVVERSKDGQWVAPTAAAAKAVHEKSQSVCALAARILPLCSGTGKAKAPKVRPTAAEKESMRKFLGL